MKTATREQGIKEINEIIKDFYAEQLSDFWGLVAACQRGDGKMLYQFWIDEVGSVENFPETALKNSHIKRYMDEQRQKANVIHVGATIDSREVAEMIGKRHAHLIRDIQKYALTLGNSIEPKIGFNDFFIESTYQDSIGRTLPCYLLTRKGCEFVANKMTGEKGVLFTAAYINKFHEMKQALQSTDETNVVAIIPEKSTALEVKVINAKTQLSNQWLKLSKLPALTDQQRKAYQQKAVEALT